MKNILGLDLGSSSIGWAVIRENSEGQELVAMGSRVVSLTAAELSSFTQGNGVSINSQRTQKRTQRKGYDRYQLRRTLLRNKLDTLGMLPDDSLSHLLYLICQRYKLESESQHDVGTEPSVVSCI